MARYALVKRCKLKTTTYECTSNLYGVGRSGTDDWKGGAGRPLIDIVDLVSISHVRFRGANVHNTDKATKSTKTALYTHTQRSLHQLHTSFQLRACACLWDPSSETDSSLRYRHQSAV